MADSKDIRFRIDADDSAFNQKMQAIKQRMKDFERSENLQQTAQSGQGGFSPQAKQAFERQNQMQRKQLMRDEQMIGTQIDKKERQLGKISKIIKDTNLDQTNQNKLTQEQVNLLEKQKTLINEISTGHQKIGTLRKSQGLPVGAHQQPLGPVPAAGGGGDQGGGGGAAIGGLLQALRSGSLGPLLGSLGMAGLGAGAAFGGIAMGNRAFEGQMAMPRESLVTRAQGAGLTSQLIGEAQGDAQGSLKSIFFAKERERAMRLARKEQANIELVDAMTGIGTATPTDILRDPIGALGGGIINAARSVGGSKGRFTGYMGSVLGVESWQESYNSQIKAEANLKAKQAMDAAEKEKPLKEQDLKFFERYKGAALQSQRMTQMGDEDFYDQMSRMSGAGFTPGEMMNSMQEMAAAGGSTDVTRRSAGFAMQAQRQGIQGAGAMMGRISRVQGGAEQTEQEFIKMLAEGSRIGLNSSDLPQETRAFADQVTKFAAKFNIQDLGALAATIANSMQGEPLTQAGIAAAVGAEGAFQGVTGETGGPRAYEEFADMLSGQGFSKGKGLQNVKGQRKIELANALSRSKLNQLTKDNDTNRQRAADLGYGPDEFELYKEDITNIKTEKAVVGDRAGKLRDNIKKMAEADPNFIGSEKYNEMVAEYTDALAYTNSDLVGKDKTIEEQRAIAIRTLGLDPTATEEDINAVKNKLRPDLGKINREITQDTKALRATGVLSPAAEKETRDRLQANIQRRKAMVEQMPASEQARLAEGMQRQTYLDEQFIPEGLSGIKKRLGEVTGAEGEGDAGFSDYLNAITASAKELGGEGASTAVSNLNSIADAVERIGQADPEKINSFFNVPGLGGGPGAKRPQTPMRGGATAPRSFGGQSKKRK